MKISLVCARLKTYLQIRSLRLSGTACCDSTSNRLNRCRGQCYDGATNMAGHRSGVAKQLGDEEPRANFVHCYGHSLNLACATPSRRLC